MRPAGATKPFHNSMIIQDALSYYMVSLALTTAMDPSCEGCHNLPTHAFTVHTRASANCSPSAGGPVCVLPDTTYGFIRFLERLRLGVSA